MKISEVMQSIQTWRSPKDHIVDLYFLVVLLICYILLRKHFDLLPLLLIVAAGIVVLIFSNRIGKSVFLAALGILTCMERHFIIHYNDCFKEIGSQALITMQITHPDEISNYMSLLKPIEFVLPILFLAGIAAVWLEKARIKPKKQWVWGILALPLFLSVLCYNVLPPVQVFVSEWANVGDVALEREAFTFEAYSTRPEENQVAILVLGESQRQDYFDDLITPRWAPLLYQARQEGAMLAYTDMISHYPQTWFAIFTALTRREADDLAPYFPEKGIPTLFKEAGFKVHYVNYQPKNPGAAGYDYLITECHSHISHRETSGTRFDMGMEPIVRRLLAEETGKVLIIIKMVGAHFNFHTRHPAEFAVNLPCHDRQNFKGYKIEEKELALNSYRNVLHYSGYFLNELARLAEQEERPSMMLFLSDHGLTLFDDGVNPFFGDARGSFHIPFLIYGNPAFWSGIPAEQKANLKEALDLPLTHRYLFETFATLNHIDFPDRRPQLDLTSDQLQPARDRQVWVWKTRKDYDSLAPEPPAEERLKSPAHNHQN